MLRALQKTLKMSLRPFDDLFYRPTHRLHVYPSHFNWSPYTQWPSLLSDSDSEYDDFIRSVDDRFSGMLANVFHGPRSVDAEHKEGAEGAERPKKYQMKLAAHGFKPEDVTIKVQGNNLIVGAKREEKKEQEGMYAHSYREFKRTFQLPEGVDKKQLSTHLTSGGVLEIEAPIVAAIEHKPEKQKIEVTHMDE